MATQKLAGRLFSNGAGGGTWTLSNGLAGTFTTKTYSYITLPDGSIKVDYTQEIKDSAGGLIAEHAGSFTSTDPTKLSGSYNGAWSVETTGNNSYSYNNYRDGILIGGGNFTTNYPLFVKSAQASSALISQYRPKEVFGSNAQDTISSKSSEGVWGLGGNDNLSTNSGTFGSFLVGGSGSDNYLVTGNSGAIIFELPNQGSDKLTLSNISLESQTSYVGTVDDRHVFAYDTSGQFVMVVDGLQSGGIDTIQLGNQTYSYDYIKTNLRQLPNFLGNLSWSQYDQQLEGGILALQGLNKTSIDQLIQEVARVAPLLEASGGPVSTYSLTTTSALLNEGATITTTATTTNVASGITLYYALSGTGISSSDFSAGALTGSGTVGTDGKFSFSHTLANDLTTEGTESLEIKLFSDSARTTQVGSTASVTIADTSTTPAPTYSLSTSAASINEGATLTTTAATTNVASGTTLYYALSGTGITASDFSAGALTGSGTVGTDGKFSFSHTLSNDLTTEGAEIILIGLYTDAGRLNQIAKAETLIIDRQRESASLLKSKPAEADRLSLNFILAPSQRISLGNGDPFRTSGERMSYQRAYLDSDLNYIIDGQATSSNRPTSLAQWKKVIYRVTTPGGAASLIDLDALLYSRYGQWRTIAGTLSYTTSENVDSIDKAYIRLDVKDPVSGSHTIYDLEIGDFATILDNRGIINAVIDDARLSFSRYVEGIARHFGFDQTYSDPANNIYYSNPTQYGYLYDEDTEVALTINNPFNGSVATQGLWVSVLEKGDGFSAYYLSTKGFQPSKILDLVHSSGADYALIEGVDQALQITTHRIFEISIDERPVLNTPLPTSTTNRGLAFSYTLPSNLFSDTDSTLTISATTATGAALPTWLSFNPSTRTLSGTPTSGGTLNLAVSAADELGSVSAPLTLKVREVQSLSSNPAPIRYQRNKDLTVPINYSTTDGSSSTGLAFKVHFNSSLFSFDPVTGVSNKATADLFQIGAVQSDTSNTDGDATTDKFIPINVASFSGSFPSGATPIKLADLIFKAADKAIDPLTGLKDTKINFSETEAAQGYGFQGTGASLKPMSFNLDVDGDGKVTALGDGLMVIRHLFGSAFSGSALTDKAISPTSPFLGGVAYNTMSSDQKTQVASLVATNIQQGIDAGLLDVDKDGKTTALGDGLMVIRNLFGSAFSGTALIDKAISPTSPYLGGLTYATMSADQKLAASGLVTANIDALRPTIF